MLKGRRNKWYGRGISQKVFTKSFFFLMRGLFYTNTYTHTPPTEGITNVFQLNTHRLKCNGNKINVFVWVFVGWYCSVRGSCAFWAEEHDCCVKCWFSVCLTIARWGLKSSLSTSRKFFAFAGKFIQGILQVFNTWVDIVLSFVWVFENMSFSLNLF